jgi:antitoxin ChpS
MSHATLRAQGDSIVLTIPKKLLESVGLDVGDRVSIAIERGRIVLGKAQRPRYRLADLLAQCKGKRFVIDREWLDAPRVSREEI